MRTVHANAKYYTDKDIVNKLKIFVSSEVKFDEFIEFGFPIKLERADLELIGAYEEEDEEEEAAAAAAAAASGQSNGYLDDHSSTLEKIQESAEGGENIEREAAPSLSMTQRSSTFSSASTNNTSKTSAAAPMSAVPREMTIKFTLTPASMRADESILYGWQDNNIAGGDGEGFDSEDPTPTPSAMSSTIFRNPSGLTSAFGALAGSAGAAAFTSSGNSSSNSHVTAVPHDPISTNSAIAIPACGFGKEGQSSKQMMRRVFSRLKKPQKSVSGSSVMITSADLGH